MHQHLFYKTILFKEWMKKFVALLIKEKEKPAMNEWKNDDTDIFQDLCSVCKIFR